MNNMQPDPVSFDRVRFGFVANDAPFRPFAGNHGHFTHRNTGLQGNPRQRRRHVAIGRKLIQPLYETARYAHQAGGSVIEIDPFKPPVARGFGG